MVFPMKRLIDFDFEEMAGLARSNPGEFAIRRKLLIEQAIALSNSPEIAKNFQFEIDQMRLSSAVGLGRLRIFDQPIARCAKNLTDEVSNLLSVIAGEEMR